MKKFNKLSFKERKIFLTLLQHSKLFLEYCKENNKDENEFASAIYFIQYKMEKGFYIDTNRYFDFAIPYDGYTYYDDLLDGHSYCTYYECA